jgi:hypothetical protein
MRLSGVLEAYELDINESQKLRNVTSSGTKTGETAKNLYHLRNFPYFHESTLVSSV